MGITYQLQYRTCGKAACSTCKEGQGHGPYWYSYWHEGAGNKRRLRSGYIGKVAPAPVVARALELAGRRDLTEESYEHVQALVRKVL